MNQELKELHEIIEKLRQDSDASRKAYEQMNKEYSTIKACLDYEIQAHQCTKDVAARYIDTLDKELKKAKISVLNLVQQKISQGQIYSGIDVRDFDVCFPTAISVPKG